MMDNILSLQMFNGIDDGGGDGGSGGCAQSSISCVSNTSCFSMTSTPVKGASLHDASW
ncbi:MAG: hypothetical protein JF614_04205 [Acidobacteria bacterium]|nr:hypothetical protein [Acidobacteriota bacterium]